MAAITWRNVDAPSLGDPSRTLLAAQQGMQQGFQDLGGVLKDYQANREQNWLVGKNNNTEDFLARASTKFATPEAFKAALASGQLDGEMAAYGGQVDKAAVRQFLDNRGSILQQRALAENQYNDAQQELRLRPALQTVRTLAVKGDKAAVDAALANNPELMARHGADLVKEGIVSDQQLKQFQWQSDRAAEAKLLAPVTLSKTQAEADAIPINAQSQRISANASATSASAAVRNAATNEQQLAFQSGEALQKRLEALQKARGEINTTIASPEGTQFVTEGLSKALKDDPAALKRAEVAFGEIVADKNLRNVNPAAVLQALVGDRSLGTPFRRFFWDGSGDGAKRALMEVMNTPDYQARVAQKNARSAELGNEIEFLRKQLYPGQQSSAAAPAGGSGGGVPAAAAQPAAAASVSPAAQALTAAAAAQPSTAAYVIPPPPAKTYKPDGIKSVPNPAREAWDAKYTQAAYDKQEKVRADAAAKAEDDALAALKANYRRGGSAEKKTLN